MEGRQYESIGEHCFLWEKRPINWDSGRQVCEQEGFQLASITSNIINNYVAEGMASRRMDNIWIGGTDKEKEGTWKWTDGSPFEFIWWRPGQPDNYKGKEYCLHVVETRNWSMAMWNDWPCTNEGEGFVCARKKAYPKCDEMYDLLTKGRSCC